MQARRSPLERKPQTLAPVWLALRRSGWEKEGGCCHNHNQHVFACYCFLRRGVHNSTMWFPAGRGGGRLLDQQFIELFDL